MSGKISGGGGLGEVFRKLLAANPSAAEPASNPGASAPKLGSDVLSIGQGAGGVSRLTLAAESAGPASPKDAVRGAQDLNDLIATLTRQEFPGLKLTPVQAAGLTSYLRDQLQLRGMNDGAFKELKDHIG